MRRSSLAKALVNATSTRERKRLLAAYERLADGRLAVEIRKICYASWTSKPTEAQRASIAANALRDFRSEPEVQANAEWVSGISNITKGKFEEAVDDLIRRSKAAFARRTRLLNRHKYLSRRSSLSRSWAEYDQAVKAGRTAFRIFIDTGNDLAGGKIEMNLCNIAARRSRHREAEKRGLSALDLFIKAGERSWQAMAENNLANIYMVLNDFRQARHFLCTCPCDSAFGQNGGHRGGDRSQHGEPGDLAGRIR